MNNKIIISFTKQDEGLLNSIVSKYPNNIKILKSKNFDGVDEIFQAIVTLTAALLPYLLDVYKKKKKEKKGDFSIKHNGIEIKIEDEKDFNKILNKILKESKKKEKKKKDDD